MPRSEEQILTGTGGHVKLGNKTYEIKPLTMRKAMKWRQGLSPLLTAMLEKDGALDSRDGLRAAVVDSLQQMTDAVVSYLDLDEAEKEQLLDDATEEEVMGAFFAVMGLAFRPITGQRALAEMMLNPTLIEKTLASAAPSKLQ